MKSSNQYFIRTVRNGTVVKVPNTRGSKGRRRAGKMKSLREIHMNVGKPHSGILIAGEMLKCELNTESDKYGEDDLDYGITLNQLKGQMTSLKKRKRRQRSTYRHSDHGDTSDDDDDHSDLKEPLIKLKSKCLKKSAVRKQKNRNICSISSTKIEEYVLPEDPLYVSAAQTSNITVKYETPDVDDIFAKAGISKSPCKTEFVDSGRENLLRPGFVDGFCTKKGASQNAVMMELGSDKVLVTLENRPVLISDDDPCGNNVTSNVTTCVPWNGNTLKLVILSENLLLKIRSAWFDRSLLPWLSTSNRYKLLLDQHLDKRSKFYSLLILLLNTGVHFRYIDTRSLAIENPSSSSSLAAIDHVPLEKQASSWTINRGICTKKLHLHSRVKMLPCSSGSLSLHDRPSPGPICLKRKRKSKSCKPKISTGCTSLRAISKNAITFSRKQMHDTEGLVERLMNQLKELKDVVKETLLFHMHRNVAARNGANEVLRKANNLEDKSRKFLSVMARDCNRFCKIMEMNASNDEGDGLNRVPNLRQRRTMLMGKRKIMFADEVGEKLCHVKHL